MKILLISSGSGSRGGGEIYLYLLARGLSNLGHSVMALIPAHQRMDELADQMGQVAEVRRHPYVATYDRTSRPIGAWLARAQQTRMTQLIRQIGADIVHINQQVSEDGLDLLIAADRSGTPWLSTIHVGWGARELDARLGTVRDLVARRVIRALNGVHLAVSKASKSQLDDRLGLEPEQIRFVWNGVLAQEPTQLAKAAAAARAEWGVAAQDLVIGAVGRIEPQKDPIAFVERFAEIATPQHPLHLVWIGDGSLRPELERFAAQFSDRIKLTVDGWRDDAGQRLAGFNIFAMPSKFEGLPLALLEAMHAGLPIIANQADGIGEAITHEKNGFMCGSPSDWHAAAELLINQPDVRKRIGEAARDAARAHFSVASMAKSTDELYQQTLARRRHGRRPS